MISLGKPTSVITPPTLRRERYRSNGWSPEAVSTMKCREFFRDCKSKRSYIHGQFSGKAEQTLLSCYLYSQHKKTIQCHIQNCLPGTLKSSSKIMRKIVICYLFLPCENNVMCLYLWQYKKNPTKRGVILSRRQTWYIPSLSKCKMF